MQAAQPYAPWRSHPETIRRNILPGTANEQTPGAKGDAGKDTGRAKGIRGQGRCPVAGETIMPDRDEVYLEWLAAAPKGVRWDKAQEMYELYQERRREQAAAVADRLLGIKTHDCPTCGNKTTKPVGQGFCSQKCANKWDDADVY